MSRKFVTEKEIAFIHRVTHELIKNVTGQVVFYYEIDLKRSRVDDLYQETVQKVWKAPVKCNARVLWGNETSNTTNFGVDSKYSLEVYFHPEELRERNLKPREGDFIEFGQVFFEITSVTEPEIIFGQVNNKTDTKCVCVPAREGQFAAGGRSADGIDNSHPIENVTADFVFRGGFSGSADPIYSVPSGAVLYVASWNVNGSGNLGLSNGSAVNFWKNMGTGSVNAIEVGPTYNPYLKVTSGETPVVTFDGVADNLIFQSTTGSMAFLHTTGIFDIFFVTRRLSSQGGGSPFGSTVSSAEKGLYTEFNAAGNMNFILTNGVPGAIVNTTPTLPAPIGTPVKYLFRGTGTHLSSSQDFSTFAVAAYTAPLASGSATNSFRIGALDATPGSRYNGDIMELVIYDRNLTADELTQMGNYIQQRVGV